MNTYKNPRTESSVRLAEKAYRAGAYQRCLDLLAEADGLEAWAFADCGSESRQRIAATIRKVKAESSAA